MHPSVWMLFASSAVFFAEGLLIDLDQIGSILNKLAARMCLAWSQLHAQIPPACITTGTCPSDNVCMKKYTALATYGD